MVTKTGVLGIIAPGGGVGGGVVIKGWGGNKGPNICKLKRHIINK